MSNIRRTAGVILTLAISMAAMAGAQTAAGAPAASEKPQPKAVVVEPLHDFGMVTKSAKVDHEFVIRNDGTAALTLREARPDCACAVVSFDQTVAPGASGKVHVQLDPADQTGAIRKSIVVFTNDPVSPELQLTVTAEIQPAINMRPGYVRYIYVQKEVPGVVTQTLWSVDGRDFKVLEVKSPYPFLQATFAEAKPEERLAAYPGKQWRVATILDPDSPVGALELPLIIRTDHPLQRELQLAVTGFVRPVLAVTPPNADFGKLSAGAGAQGSLALRSFSTEPIPVTATEIDIAGATATLQTVTEGRSYTVKVVLPKDLPKGAFSGRVKITTSSPKIPSLEVPIRGVVE